MRKKNDILSGAVIVAARAGLLWALLLGTGHAQEQRSIPPGTYSGMVFSWPIDITITGTDEKGQLLGTINIHQSDAERGLGQGSTHASPFRTHVGADGLPETTFSDGSKYSDIRIGEGGVLAARFCFGNTFLGCRNIALNRR